VLSTAGAEVVRGDLLDQASVARACSGADRVVAAAHSLFGRGREASVHVDGRGHRHLIDAAKAAHVRHFVYTSVYDSGPACRGVPFFRIKFEVEDHLRGSGLSYTILRPTAFMEVHAHALIGEPILRRGKTVLFGRGESPRNFVAVDDVAQFVMRAVLDPSLAGQTVNVGGPENLTSMEVVALYERMAGRRANVTRVPVPLLRLASLLTRPFHPGLSQAIRASVIADTTDQRFDVGSLPERFSIQLTRLEDWMRRNVSTQV
jgi:uncharacterized protein YbjT (DUF2867 family)